MADQKNKNIPVSGEKSQSTLDSPALRSRRALIKGAAATVPMILTLQSGAALAVSSNLIGAASEAGAMDENGNSLCLDASQATMEGALCDLGEPAEGMVNLIHAEEFRTEPNRGSRSQIVGTTEVCQGDQPFYYHDGVEWNSVEFPQGGMLVSAIALNSFADGAIRFNDMSRM